MAEAPNAAVPDFAGTNRDELIDRLLAYAGSELLCHRADEPELTEAQQKAWQPLLDWCAERFQAPLKTGVGIVPIPQPAASLRALRRAVESYEGARFAALFWAVQASGSLVVGLALAEGRITAAEAFEAAELDALHQAKKWGEVDEAKARREAIRRELELCERELKMLERQPPKS